MTAHRAIPARAGLALALLVAAALPASAEPQRRRAVAPALPIGSAAARPTGGATILSRGGMPTLGSAADADRLLRWLNARYAQRAIDPDPFGTQMSSVQATWINVLGVIGGQSSLLVPGIGGTSLLVQLYVPETGLTELFTLYVPDTPPGVERPLLMCFHVYGSSHLDIAARTTYLREAQNRGWFLVAPLQHGGMGLYDVNFGSAESQKNVEAVVRLMLDNYDIDRDRIYGVGFSMGGGSALSYAARHRDRRQGAFAAVVNHTGTVALTDVYQSVNMAVRGRMETLLGGTPLQAPFEWTRSSLVVLDAAGQLVPGADHMAANLSNTPIRTIYGTTDTMTYLIDQSHRLDEFFLAYPSSRHELRAEPVPPEPNCLVNGHCWDTADEVLVCDWLGAQALDPAPSSGTVLADRGGRWGRFDVAQTAADEFTRFDFAIDAPTNHLAITSVENLKDVSFDLAQLGLDKTALFTVGIESTGAGGEDYKLRQMPNAPLIVLRDGFQITQSCAGVTGMPSWCYLASTGELVLHEPGGTGTRHWSILP